MLGFECGAGLTCEAGSQVCRGPSKEGEACHLTRPCAAGLSCEAGSHVCRAPSKEGEACHLTRPCAAGLSCEAGSQVCRAPGEVGDACHLTRPCGSELSCQPGVHKCYNLPRRVGQPCVAGHACGDGLYCQAGSQTCVPDPLDLTSIQSCGSARVGDMAIFARDAGATMSYGAGAGAAVGIKETIEEGTVYGEDGQFGCYISVCGGAEADVNIGTYAAWGVWNSWDDFAGSSFTINEGVSIPVVELGFSTSQVLNTAGTFIGSVNSLTFGVGINPVGLGAMNCCTAVLNESQTINSLNNSIEACRQQLEGIGAPPATNSDGLLFGGTYYIKNTYSAGSYLDTCGNATCTTGTKYNVVTNTQSNRGGYNTGKWRIESAAGKLSGAPVLIGDVFYLKNQYAEGSYLETCGSASCTTGSKYNVVTNKDSNRGGYNSGKWKIVSASGKAVGQPVNLGDRVYLQNMYGEGSYLETCGYSDCTTGSAYNVVTHTESNRGGHGTGTWVFEKP